MHRNHFSEFTWLVKGEGNKTALLFFLEGASADYIVTGAWSAKAAKEVLSLIITPHESSGLCNDSCSK